MRRKAREGVWCGRHDLPEKEATVIVIVNIFITIITVIDIIAIEIFTYEFWTWPATWAQIKTFGGPGGTKNMSLLKTRLKECDLRCNVIAEKIRHLFTFIAWPSFLRNCKWVQVSPPFVFVSTKIPRDTTNPVFLPERQCNEFNITWNWNVQCLVQTQVRTPSP